VPPGERILLVSSSGGVLLDLLALEHWWSRYQTAWAAVPAEDTRSALASHRVHWISDVSVTSPLGLLASVWHAWRIVSEERPHLLVSAGSGAAIGFFLAARLRGIPSFWLSTLNLVRTPSLSGRICGRLASRVFVQRSSMLSAHSNTVLLGELY
jgi:UDP-N-acetylglucosamine:LPS N-acetylglucosamine transferase